MDIRRIKCNSRSIKKVVYNLYICFCIFGLYYHLSILLSNCFHHPILVTEILSDMEQIELPAFTACNRFGFPRYGFCPHFPSRCYEPENIRDFCSTYRDFCILAKITGGRLAFLDDKAKAMILSRFMMSQMQAHYPVFKHVTYISDKIQSCCKSYKFRIAYDENGRQQLCYSVNVPPKSSSGFPLMAFSQKSYYLEQQMFRIDLDTQSHETHPDDEVGMAFAIHSPYETVNPFEKGIILHAGNNYKINVEPKLVLTRNPEQCVNYLDSWIEIAEDTAAMSQQDCIMECIEKLYYDECGCLIKKSMKIMFGKECNLKHSRCVNNVSESSCKEKCKPDCRRIGYTYKAYPVKRHYTGNETYLKKAYMEISGYTKQEHIKVLLKSDQQDIMGMSHLIGGSIGLWIGTSLFAIYIWAEKKILNICSKNKLFLMANTTNR